MSDETRHPERRAGQRTATGYGCTYGDRTGGPWCPAHDEGEDGWKLWNDGVSAGMKEGEALCPDHADAPATTQPSALVVDRAGCKTWCGHRTWNLQLNDPARMGRAATEGYVLDDMGIGVPAWCSPACRDAKLPPLAAQPAEAKLCSQGTQGCDAGPGADGRIHSHRQFCKDQQRAKPAEQPKPAKGPQRCENNDCETPLQNVAQRWCSFTDGSGRAALEWSCEPCCLKDEAEFAELTNFGNRATAILRDPAIPERLPRPRLAHSMGIEDPTLPEAR